MCLAIAKPAGKFVTKEHLENGFSANSHGAGLAWAYEGKLWVEKGFFKFDEFYKVYEKVQALPCLIHFRIRTSGPQDKGNCHPWEVTPNLALIHNGILSLKEVDNLSDTGTFTNYVLKPLVEADPECWKRLGFKWLIEEAIGMGNKIAMMDHTGEQLIFNQKAGEWEAGAWFSNTSFKRYRYVSAGFERDYDGYPGERGAGSYNNRHHSACSGTTRTYTPAAGSVRWIESSIPNVYLLSREHANKWIDKTNTPNQSADQKSDEAEDAVVMREVERLKGEGWVEWEAAKEMAKAN